MSDLITKEQLRDILGIPLLRAAKFIDPINQTLNKYGITTNKQIAAFLANIGHESANLSALVENLNYTAVGLAKTWPGRFAAKNARGVVIVGEPNELAKQIQHKPEVIANNVYANRMGNGDIASGDGWKYRGRGIIAATGRNMYAKLSKNLGVDLVAKPELLEDPLYACLSAGDYWNITNINVKADVDDFDGCCDLINIGRKTQVVGDAIGYGARRTVWIKAKQILA